MEDAPLEGLALRVVVAREVEEDAPLGVGEVVRLPGDRRAPPVLVRLQEAAERREAAAVAVVAHAAREVLYI